MSDRKRIVKLKRQLKELKEIERMYENYTMAAIESINVTLSNLHAIVIRQAPIRIHDHIEE